MGQKQKKREYRRSNRTRQNNKRADRKMESNDSPVVPDRGEEIRRVPASLVYRLEMFHATESDDQSQLTHTS